MDFIIHFLISNSYDFIWGMINPFIIIAYFVLLEINRKKKLITLSAFLLSIISDYTVYPRILFLIGIPVLYLGFRKISLNLLVLSPG